ncbi:hypothetical protein CAPTEDRAFT_211667 [Capitella teleta]|uniref:G-protein coupled receptors family 1 profile domain-containing protein n=1 Tax=Capitella teleta TaxID=283909 RepID=R7UUN4_CAPTE|nr:hypothetical protein CAPTEDRAFT_211667 [Capitella teleta]|eukprot:ELU07627.1 hypothetical protein CAPTEDRAFT_211667 [Capitella teleta]
MESITAEPANLTQVDNNETYWNNSEMSLCSNEDHPACFASNVLTYTGTVIGILSVVLNLTFLIVIRSLRDATLPYSILLQNLSISDIMASVTFLLAQNWPQGPFGFIEPTADLILVQGLPYVFRGTPWMFFTGYLLTLTCLTIIHYVAVCRPWRYSEISEKRLIHKSLALVWLVSALQLIVPATVLAILCLQEDRRQAMDTLYEVSTIEIQIWMALFAFSAIVNITLDVLVYQKIKHLKFKRRRAVYTCQENRNIRSKHEAFVTVSLLMLTSLFCRLPFPLMAILGFSLSSVLGPHSLLIINSLTVLLLHVNFFADPVIYVLRMKEVRKCLVILMSGCLQRFKHTTETPAKTYVMNPLVKETTHCTSVAEVSAPRRCSTLLKETDTI